MPLNGKPLDIPTGITGLLQLGLTPGDRVASLMPNRTALLIHYIACMRAGLVPVPLNYRYPSAGIDHALEISEASLLVAHAERAQDLNASKRVTSLSGVRPDRTGQPSRTGTVRLTRIQGSGRCR